MMVKVRSSTLVTSWTMATAKRRGTLSLGSRIRSQVILIASAFKGVPSLNLTPARSLKV